MYGDVGDIELEIPGHRLACIHGRLHGCPYFGFAVGHVRHGYHGFHLGVRQVRHIVLGRHAAGGPSQRSRHVAVGAAGLARLPDRLFERLLVGRAVVGGVGAVIPRNAQGVASLHRRPRARSNHGDASEGKETAGHRRGRDGHNALNPLHLFREGVVNAHHRATPHRRACDHRHLHAGQHDVGTVDGRARRHGHEVDTRHRLAFPSTLDGRFDAHARSNRHGNGTCRTHECTKGNCASAGGVTYHAVLRHHITRRNTPLTRGGVFEQGAHCGSCFPVLGQEVADAGGAVGVLTAVLGFIAERLHNTTARPVGFHFVGDDHGHGGANALSHLGPMTDNGHRAVFVEANVRVRLPRLGLGCIGCRERRRGGFKASDADGAGHHQQPARAQLLEELTTCVGRRVHRGGRGHT